MKGKTKIKRVLALVLTIAALAAGQSAWAASTFTLTSSTSAGITTFTITRSESTATETVYYRTVSLSAIEGQHFTAVSGSLTFTAGQTSKTVTVTEGNPDAEVYRYQTGSRRSYRFEVLDIDGTVITHRDQTVNTTTPFTYSGTNVNNAIPNNSFVFLNGDPANLIGIGNCIDVAYTPPTSQVETSGTYQGYVLIDDSYDYSQKAATVSTNTLINSTGATAACLKTMGYKIYATVCFTMKEKNDGYYYVQIIPGTANASYDGADSEGSVKDPAYSVYKACFELKEGSGVYSGEGKMFFPHRFDYANRAAGGLNGTGTSQTNAWTEFPLAESKLWQQKFKSGYRDNNTGSVVLDPDVASITTRFDCAGSDNDTWGFKDLYVRMGLVDATAPTALNNYKVSGGRHQKGNIIYVSVPFSELVTVEGTPTLTTTWGTLSYIAGSGSNVLTFSGVIASNASGTLSISALSGTVKDLAGNAFSGTVSKNFGISLDATYVWSLSDFNQLATNTYEIATKTDLYRLANIVNVSRNECSGITFLQTQDIVCDAGYSPIGYQGDNDHSSFRGTYDGQGHTVSGITVTRTGNTKADSYIGLFGYIYYGTVQNVVLANSTFTGYRYVGGIAGEISWGTVRNCRVESSVTIRVGNSPAENFGGVVGYFHASGALMTGCVSAATIENNGLTCNDCGGISGDVSYCTLKDCLYIGTSVTGTGYVGSIAGSTSSATISNNYYTAISLGGIGVSSTSSDQDGARRARTITLGEGISLSGTETTYDVSGITAYGSTAIGYGGKIYSGAGQTLSLTYNVPDGFSFEGFSVNGTAIDGNTFTVPAADVTVSANFARLPIGSISYNATLGAYEINCAQHLRDLAEYVNGEYEIQGEIQGLGTDAKLVTEKEGHNCAGLTFKMTADIDFAPTSTWDDYGSDEHNYTAIGCWQKIYVNADPMYMDNPFSGTFDGQGHTISGIRINKGSSSYQGLFGYISGGTVRNVKLSDTRITGRSYTGGIVGENKGGTIADCEAGHTVAVHNVQQNTVMVGGIVGENLESSSVTGCTSAAVITCSAASCSSFGGVVGRNEGSSTVSGCTAAGVIVPNVANSGAVVGNNSGTLSGNKYHSSLVGSYAFNIGTGTGDVEGTAFTKSFFLYTDRDNSALLDAYAATYSGNSSTAHGGTHPTVANLSVTLKGYILHKDGSWNTIALPFDFSNLNYANSPLNGATVKELDTSSTAYDSETGTLTVAFKTATSISAGKPYIVKWDSGTDVTDPTFSGISGSHFSTSNAATNDAPIKIQGSSAKPFASTDGLLFDSHNADNQVCHAAISLSAPAESPGSTFEGWFTDEQRTVAPTVIPFGTDGSFSLYAKLTKNELTLTEADGVSTLTSQWQGKQVEVSFSRQFSAGKASTICLPFPMTSISGGKVYEFQDVTYNSSEGWVATMVDATPNMVTETIANTPYLFLPDADGSVTFSGTIDNVPASVTAGTTESGDWTFHGTYSRLDYGTEPFSGTVFGFAATGGKANDGQTDVTAGQFIKAADGAFIQPFRAYLTYSGSNSALQAPSRRVQSDVMPDRITVRLTGKGGGTTAVGTINTATGEVTIERWFNLNGQPVDGTPAAPGLYLNSDGRKVLISE